MAAVISVAYSLLPFYSVYGLAIMGQPLLWYGIAELWKKRSIKAYIIGGLFALFSSPVLVGFADCILIAFLIMLSIKETHRAISLFLLLILMVGIYGILYRELIVGVAGGREISHRSEAVLSLENWKDAFFTVWNGNQQHAVSEHTIFMPWVILIAVGGLAFFSFLGKRGRKQVILLAGLLGAAVLIALFYAFFHSELLVKIRDGAGEPLRSFQLDRFYWLYPGLWYTALGLAAGVMLDPDLIGEKGACGKGRRIVSAVLCAALLAVTGWHSLMESNVKRNIGNLIGRHNEPTFGGFYSPELFDDIREYIKKPQQDYKVASIGLYPAVPLYNGFYCVDGYSNNYPLDYKHRFREIISGELEKSADLRSYFDEWGNRCYIFSAELGSFCYYTKEDHGIIRDLRINVAALKEMGCEYLLSGVEIGNAEENGLMLLKTFENQKSPYCISVYSLYSNLGTTRQTPGTEAGRKGNQ